MNDEQDLRERLDAIDVPPTRITVGALLPAVRKSARRRRQAQAAGIVTLVAAALVVPTVARSEAAGPATPVMDAPSAKVSRSASAKPVVAACAMTKLPVPAGLKEPTVSAVDPSGRYVVGYSVSGMFSLPLLWTDGKAGVPPAADKSVEMDDVNADGVVAGVANDKSFKNEWVFRYQNGKYTRLTAPAGNWHFFPGAMINAAGDVLVNAEPQGNSGGDGAIVLFWKAGSTTAIKVPLPTGANGLGLADDDTIVGAIYKGLAGADSAYVWHLDGSQQKLKTPAGDKQAAAYDVAGDWATGGSWPSQTAVLWNLKTGKVTKLAHHSPADKVNANGWVVTDGVVIHDGLTPKLVTAKGEQAGAVAVSDTGLVVGNVGQSSPRVWQC